MTPGKIIYSFPIKDDERTLEVSSFRGILLMAVLWVGISRNENVYLINAIAFIILLAGLFLVRYLLLKLHINKLLLAFIAAALVSISTHDHLFAIFLFIMGAVLHFSYVQPTLEVSETGIAVKRSFQNKKYTWPELNNVVYKDGLLTIDFKNNKILQLEVKQDVVINEKNFNDYATQRIIG